MRESEHTTRLSLVERCRRGERDAFHALYANHYHQLFKTAQHYVDSETARDIVHDAMIIAITSIGSLRDPNHLEAWLNQIVRNIALNHIKHSNVIQTLPLEAASDVPDEAVDDAPIPFEVLLTMVERLPNGYKQVFRLKTLAGMNHDEIAHQLGISSSTSRSQFYHARRLLSTMIHHWWMPVAIIAVVALCLLIDNDTKHAETAGQPKVADNTTVEMVDTSPTSTSNEVAPHPHPYGTTLSVNPYSTEPKAKEDASDTLSAPLTVDSIPAARVDSAGQKIVPSPSVNDLKLAEDNTLWKASGQSSRNLSLSLAFNGLPNQADVSQGASIQALSSMAPSAGSDIASEVVNFDNWSDYYSFMAEETLINPTEENRSLKQIAASNAVGNPQQHIERLTHHDLPFTVSLALNKTVTNRWSVGTGLSYSHLHSVFDLGYSQAFIRDSQTIHYLGVPVNTSYTLLHHPRFSLYGTVGATLDIPVASSLTTLHLLMGQTTFSRQQHLSVPIQWSVNAGLGIQYNFTPHIGIFAQPGVTYYFNNGVQTYRSDHPWNLTIPIGLKFTW